VPRPAVVLWYVTVMTTSLYQNRAWLAIWVRVPDTRWVLDPMGTGTGTIFYSRVAPVSNPN
jgi:hypothetical protein